MPDGAAKLGDCEVAYLGILRVFAADIMYGEQCRIFRPNSIAPIIRTALSSYYNHIPTFIQTSFCIPAMHGLFNVVLLAEY